MSKKITFENALTELETIVKKMESGDLCLEDAMKNYEAGIKKSNYCIDLLDKTEEKISLLQLDQNGKITATGTMEL